MRVVHARVPPLHVGRVVVPWPAGHASAPALLRTAAAASPVLVGKRRGRLLRLSGPAPAAAVGATAAGHHVEASAAAAAGHGVAPVGRVRRGSAGIGFPLVRMRLTCWTLKEIRLMCYEYCY